jgi:hypothetical protein
MLWSAKSSTCARRSTRPVIGCCSQHRFVDAHHIHHWADGGETSIDNLIVLCRHHHRLVHEQGFGAERTAENDIRFSRPDGRVIEENPRLPATGSIEGLMGKREREDCGCDTQRA